MSSSKTIVDNVYAFLLVKYVSELEKPYRFLILGFRDILPEISDYFGHICNGELISPTGRLEKISKLRRSHVPCMIALEWEDVGKYASWTTSFKILDESLRPKIGIFGYSDVHTPTDVMIWLSRMSDILKQILDLISEKLRITFKPKEFESLRFLLEKIEESIRRTYSYSEWYHPRRIIEGLVMSLKSGEVLSTSGSYVTLGFFLRKIGMEPLSRLDEIELFSDAITNSEERIVEDYIKKYYPRVQRNYLARPYEKGTGRLRKILSNLGLNLLRRLLVDLAEKETDNSDEAGNWTKYFVEFEQGKRERRTKIRKYDFNVYGTSILGRSQVSGLPTHIRLVLTRSKDFGRGNILPQFHKSTLKTLFKDYRRKFRETHFELYSNRMFGDNSLILELLLEKNSQTVIDPYLEGLKAPTRKVNELLLKLGVE